MESIYWNPNIEISFIHDNNGQKIRFLTFMFSFLALQREWDGMNWKDNYRIYIGMGKYLHMHINDIKINWLGRPQWILFE